MSDRRSSASKQLSTVARLYELQLEHARADRTVADERAEEQRELAKEIQGRVDQAHSLAHARMRSEHGVPADTLRLSSAYAKWQTKTLEEQRERVREAERALEAAQAEVIRRYQALFAIEQLQERRESEATLEASRKHQTTMDEHALVRRSRSYGR
jgi:flagellar biosynthesis chaperone FliJ